MMRFILWILLTWVTQAAAQIPRNAAGVFEYAHTVPVNGATASVLPERARAFFRQPFLVHWDTVFSTTQASGVWTMTGRGYIDIRANNWSKKNSVPVALQFDITTDGNRYHYAIHHLVATEKNTTLPFPLEEKPVTMKGLTYDKLIDKTHNYIIRVISWMKREMSGEE